MTSNKQVVVLHTKAEWDTWIELMKTTSLKYDVWKFVNPELEDSEREQLKEPKRPTPNDVRAPPTGSPSTKISDLTIDEKDEYIFLKEEYVRDLKRYEKQREALADLRIKVQESIHPTNITFTYDCDTVHQMLRNLAAQFAPTDEIRKQEIELEWQALQTNWTSNMEVNQWLHNWEVTYNKMARIRSSDIDGLKPVYKFLNSVNTLDPQFATSWTLKLSMGDKITFPELLIIFRNYRRNISNLLKQQPQHGAFPTLQGLNEQGHSVAEDIKPFSKSSDQPKSKLKCPCGSKHKYNKTIKYCAYLIPEAAKYWKQALDPEKVTKVEKRLSADENFRKLVEKWRKEYKPPAETSTEKIQSSYSFDRPETPPTVAMASLGRLTAFNSANSTFQISSALKKPIYELESSWILDSGATIHVCNNISKFIEFNPIDKKDEVLWAGESQIQIEGYGKTIIYLKSTQYPKGRPLQLVNVAFVPTLHTNVTSLRLLNKVGIHWDTELSILKFNSKHYADTPMLFNQWVLEYNPTSIHKHVYATDNYGTENSKSTINSNKQHGNSSRTTKTQTGSFDDWHVRMGHLYEEALLKLPLATRGCKMTTAKLEKSVCEKCRLSNAKRIVSRAPRTRAIRPFWRVSWDLIQMNEGKNGDMYVQHFVCDYTHMHFVYLLPNKLQDTLMNTFAAFVAYVERRWGFKIVVWKGDGEKSLGSKWAAWINDNGYEVETSSPYTQEQNGDAERSGGVLQALGTKLRAIFDLPNTLWDEILPTAGYILNRSPTRSLGFKTPLGFLNEYVKLPNPEPSIAHLQPIGCKAFSLIKNRPKLNRLIPRAEIGYLVGYQSTNIFRIWIPSRNIVISTRDVTFDPTQGYSPTTPSPVISNEIIKILQVPLLDVDQIDDDNYLMPSQDEVSLKDSRLSILPKYVGAELKISEDNNEFKHASGLLTSADTPEPEITPTEEVEDAETEVNNPSQTPIREIIGNVGDPRNIIQGKRNRKPKAQFHLEIHQNLHKQSAFHAAFQLATRSKKPKIHKSDLPPPPENWHQLKYHPHQNGFIAAARLEFETLEKQKTFIRISENEIKTKPIPVKWVFSYKTDDDGYLLKYKARMVVRGDLQIPTEKDTYAATLATRVSRAILAICAYFDLEAHQFDVTNAFPHADLDKDEEVVIHYPDGFKIPRYRLRVLKALYGLSISPRLWYNHLANTLKKMGLVPVPESGCVFCNEKLIVCFYVNDIAVFYHARNRNSFEEFKKALFEAYTVRDMGEIKWFLGIRILRDRSERKIWILQDSYIEKIARSFKRIDKDGKLIGKPYATPMSLEELENWDGNATDNQIHDYQRRIGSLTYAAVVSRPDIAKATQKLAEAQQNPSFEHFAAVNRVIDYLYATRYLAIEYGINKIEPVFVAASDASFGDHISERVSSEGGLFKLFGGVIDYFSKKQKTVTTSSTESELLALSHVCAWLKWWQRFFEKLSLEIEEDYTVWCDNMQTVRLIIKEAPKLVTKLKHIDIHQHWLRQEFEKDEITLNWIETGKMPADGLTKSLSRQKHQNFIRQLNMVDVEKKILK